MAEEDVVKSSEKVVTRDTLASDLKAFGVQTGDTILVHSSLKAIGWTVGGPVSVLQALYDAISPVGTLVMPSQSQDLTDPSRWENPAVPSEWHAEIRSSMPAFNRELTPTRDMGRVAELFRTWPGVIRSEHPTCSFTAFGPESAFITHVQPLTDPFGDASPLSRLYELDAKVLLLGVSFDCCTALHLAERRSWPAQKQVIEGSPIMIDGHRTWVEYKLPLLRTELFADMGAQMVIAGHARSGFIGTALSHIMSCRRLVDFACSRWSVSHEALPND